MILFPSNKFDLLSIGLLLLLVSTAIPNTGEILPITDSDPNEVRVLYNSSNENHFLLISHLDQHLNQSFVFVDEGNWDIKLETIRSNLLQNYMDLNQIYPGGLRINTELDQFSVETFYQSITEDYWTDLSYVFLADHTTLYNLSVLLQPNYEKNIRYHPDLLLQKDLNYSQAVNPSIIEFNHEPDIHSTYYSNNSEYNLDKFTQDESFHVFQQLYLGNLWYITQNQSIVPYLSPSWELDGNHMIFNLGNHTFSNGENIEADNYVLTYKILSLPCLSDTIDYLKHIENVTMINSSQIRVELNDSNLSIIDIYNTGRLFPTPSYIDDIFTQDRNGTIVSYNLDNVCSTQDVNLFESNQWKNFTKFGPSYGMYVPDISSSTSLILSKSLQFSHINRLNKSRLSSTTSDSQTSNDIHISFELTNNSTDTPSYNYLTSNQVHSRTILKFNLNSFQDASSRMDIISQIKDVEFTNTMLNIIPLPSDHYLYDKIRDYSTSFILSNYSDSNRSGDVVYRTVKLTDYYYQSNSNNVWLSILFLTLGFITIHLYLQSRKYSHLSKSLQ